MINRLLSRKDIIDEFLKDTVKDLPDSYRDKVYKRYNRMSDQEFMDRMHKSANIKLILITKNRYAL